MHANRQIINRSNYLLNKILEWHFKKDIFNLLFIINFLAVSDGRKIIVSKVVVLIYKLPFLIQGHLKALTDIMFQTASSILFNSLINLSVFSGSSLRMSLALSSSSRPVWLRKTMSLMVSRLLGFIEKRRRPMPSKRRV